MAKRQFVLDEAEQNELRRAEGQTQEARELKRLQAVRLYGSGYAVSDITEVTGCSWRALMDWRAAYRTNGPGGLKSKWQGETEPGAAGRPESATGCVSPRPSP